MSFLQQPLHLLVVEDNPGDFVLFESYLMETDLNVADLHHAQTLKDVGALLPCVIHLAFLDLSLPDSNGLESFNRLHQLLPHTPIVVLSGLSDEEVALRCITLGAQDYLLKDDLNEKLLERSVRYSIERKRNLEALSDMNRKYERIGSVTNDIIWNWDVKAGRVTVHKRDFFGHMDAAIGTEPEWWLDKVHPADVQRISEAIGAVVEGRRDSFQEEYRFRGADGSYQYVFNRGVLLRDDGGAPHHITGAMMDITERKKLQEELLDAHLSFQKQITEATILGQEKEKENIGKELHDNINQVLASTKLFMEVAFDHIEMREEMVIRGRENIIYAMAEIRRLSHSLIPPSLGDHGLLDSVRELAAELEEGGAFTVRVSVDGFDEHVLDDNKKLMLYRVVQEGLNNVVKYAKASVVTVSFSVEGRRLLMVVSDNGIGFDPSRKVKGIGLKNIESRVAFYSGKVQLETAPGNGTKLNVFLPL